MDRAATSLEVLAVPFDVNDAQLRETFLRDTLSQVLPELERDAVPEWGKMDAQHMVEHLRWVFELSTGRASIDCPIPEAKQQHFRKFLFTNEPAPRDFMNPVLIWGLHPLREGNLTVAKAALELERDNFLAAPRAGGPRYRHPLFGPLDYDEWHRAHYKHVHHHFVQFGLIESAAAPV